MLNDLGPQIHWSCWTLVRDCVFLVFKKRCFKKCVRLSWCELERIDVYDMCVAMDEYTNLVKSTSSFHGIYDDSGIS